MTLRLEWTFEEHVAHIEMLLSVVDRFVTFTIHPTAGTVASRPSIPDAPEAHRLLTQAQSYLVLDFAEFTRATHALRRWEEQSPVCTGALIELLNELRFARGEPGGFSRVRATRASLRLGCAGTKR
jgi:hypothetical protein